MAQRNVPIALLLSGGQEPASQQPQDSQQDHAQARPHNLILQFQAFVGGPGLPSANQPHEVLVIDDEPEPVQSEAQPPTQAQEQPQFQQTQQTQQMQQSPAHISEQVKNFQAQFQAGQPSTHIPLPFSVLTDRQTPPAPTRPAVSSHFNLTPRKTSINSLINSDESSAPKQQPAPSPSAPPEKKKRASQKADGPNKKAKTEPKKTAKLELKAETKKTAKSKKKTPEIIVQPVEKPGIHATMATDKARGNAVQAKLAPPAFLDFKKDTSEGVEENDALGSKDKESKEKEPPQERPVIALDIPLLDPKDPQPGQAEVVINVLKLAEDKYGWNVIHPNAKSAIELMDEILDDDDDGEDDDDDDLQVVDEKGNVQKKKDELTEEQKLKKHETKMNRKVGKYDYEDPFIDDEELQWEEEITTTKEGFFVYWGPLVEDKTSTSIAKKTTGKGKK